MNKYVSKVMALGVAGLVIFGMGTPVMAENGFNTTDTASDTSQINLDIDYQKESNNSVSPEETFNLTIDRYGLWNVGEDGSGNARYTLSGDNAMPTFTNGATNTFTITASPGAAGSTTKPSKPSTTLTVPTYDAVGDYWYKVTETNNNVAGVFYGTNDNQTENTESSNGAHNATYYIHVQVLNNSDKSGYIRSVTLHKTAPDALLNNTAYESWYNDNHSNTTNQQDKKVSAIQNKYYAGSLNITKNVAGNAADKNELFKVTVKFTNASNASMKSNITMNNYYDETNKRLVSESTPLSWTDTVTKTDTTTTHSAKTKTVSFWIKNGETVHFDNIPYGVQYSVTETKPSDDKYSHEFAYGNADAETTFDAVTLAADTTKAEDSSKTGDDKWNAANATGSISDDLDTVNITNTKTSAIDVGVITSNAPYIAMLVVAGIAVVVYLRKKKMIKE